MQQTDGLKVNPYIQITKETVTAICEYYIVQFDAKDVIRELCNKIKSPIYIPLKDWTEKVSLAPSRDWACTSVSGKGKTITFKVEGDNQVKDITFDFITESDYQNKYKKTYPKLKDPAISDPVNKVGFNLHYMNCIIDSISSVEKAHVEMDYDPANKLYTLQVVNDEESPTAKGFLAPVKIS